MKNSKRVSSYIGALLARPRVLRLHVCIAILYRRGKRATEMQRERSRTVTRTRTRRITMYFVSRYIANIALKLNTAMLNFARYVPVFHLNYQSRLKI